MKTLIFPPLCIYKKIHLYLLKYPKIHGFIRFIRIKMETFKSHTKIINHGYGRIEKDISGAENQVFIGDDTVLYNPLIHIVGSNNKLTIEKGCVIGKRCSFWLEGNGVQIMISEGTTMTRDVHICAQEDDSTILIGKDCMLSNNIIIRTSDSHPIYDKLTGSRINFSKNVIIGNHVWIAPNSKIMKGANIGDGCIVGSDTMVSKPVKENCLVVGMPSKVIKENIVWDRKFS